MPEFTRKPVSSEKRLFSLVLALIASDIGLTKQQILSSVYGYADRYAVGKDNSTLERQFERDKDSVRELGIPLDAVDAPDSNGNTQLTRYRIVKSGYNSPEDLTFTSRERALLALASTVWREGSLSAESRRSLMKLSSQGISAESGLVGYSPRVHTREVSFAPLMRAIQAGVGAEFDYRKPGESRANTRRVEPLALVSYEGRWHLYSHDFAAHAPRTFLLARIVSPVMTLRLDDSVRKPGADYGARALAELRQLAAEQVAVISIRPETDAEARLGPRGHAAAVENQHVTGFIDGHLFADELAGFGPEVTVVSPPTLVSAVKARLERAKIRNE
ncbi:WYL domain-containing protein [Klugiella xanthotipulae]|uniref:Proteasome accessory factor B n=1 Tax=Klugiella xanthotipulae TaxID=244735 RepID=A0A543HSU1_9MICO|nr:WYL domain-containing protein [Klugiella xanthotipulae]TQM61405.1 proteasome accessory factor B [Klugiella xanthotipulae]